jgi:rubrerythrin
MQFEKTETYKNLARSFAGECQAGMRYQMIAKLAMEEKLKTLADTIRTIAKNIGKLLEGPKSLFSLVAK